MQMFPRLMHLSVLPFQLVPEVGLPGVLVTLVLVVLAIVVVRVVLNVAVKIAIAAGVVVGLLWFFGFLPGVSFL